MVRKVLVGRVRGVHGVRGFLKVESFTEPLETLLSYGPWQVVAGADQSSNRSSQRLFVIESGQRHGPGLLVKLQGCDSREDASALVGSSIEVDYDALPGTEPGEYYWVDLVGLSVKTPQGVVLGKVSHLFETGANDVLVVRDDGNNEHLLPYTDDVVVDVDLPQGLMTVNWEADF